MGGRKVDAVPRPNKPIIPGPREVPVVASRGSRWAKHAGPEHAAQYEPDGAILVDPMSHETVTEVDIADEAQAVVTVGVHPVTLPSDEAAPSVPKKPRIRYEWVSDREISGRVYHRIDELVAESSTG